MSTHRATAYLIVKAERSRYSITNAETGLKSIGQIKVVTCRQGRPARLERDEIAVKVTVEIPDAAFEPITPSALIVVPTDLALRGPIGVEAEDANGSGNDTGVTLDPRDGRTPESDGAGLPSDEQNRFSDDETGSRA